MRHPPPPLGLRPALHLNLHVSTKWFPLPPVPVTLLSGLPPGLVIVAANKVGGVPTVPSVSNGVDIVQSATQMLLSAATSTTTAATDAAAASAPAPVPAGSGAGGGDGGEGIADA